MLLRRITQHMKNQNWFAVFLDFLIVVVGVFIGIQVANWNAERQIQNQENSLVERLYEEVKVVDIELDNYIKVHEKLLKQRTQFALITNDEEACLTQTDTMINLVLSVGDFPPPRFTLPIATQSLNTGELAIISSIKLRDEVQEIADEMIFLSRQWQRYIITVQGVEEQINMKSGLAIKSSRDKPLFSYEAYSIERFELLTIDQVCNDTETIGSLAGLEVLQHIYVAYMLEVQESLEKYHNILEKSLKDE